MSLSMSLITCLTKGIQVHCLIRSPHRGSSRCSHINIKSPSPDRYNFLFHITSSLHLKPSFFILEPSHRQRLHARSITHYQGIFSSHSPLCNYIYILAYFPGYHFHVYIPEPPSFGNQDTHQWVSQPLHPTTTMSSPMETLALVFFFLILGLTIMIIMILVKEWTEYQAMQFWPKLRSTRTLDLESGLYLIEEIKELTWRVEQMETDIGRKFQLAGYLSEYHDQPPSPWPLDYCQHNFR